MDAFVGVVARAREERGDGDELTGAEVSGGEVGEEITAKSELAIYRLVMASAVVAASGFLPRLLGIGPLVDRAAVRAERI